MASEQQVKRYLCYWFQLGKRIVINNGTSTLLPQKVVEGDRYSYEFENIWQQIISLERGDCYLEGTTQTIGELLEPRWDIEPCARCDMPVPMINLGMLPAPCPCSDLLTWPNSELPVPREPLCSQEHLNGIRNRLHQISSKSNSSENSANSNDHNLLAATDCDRSNEHLSQMRDRLRKTDNF
ncbi:MAG: hypothetical protein F6J89_03760 [Symploca sp. SIO1C4]|uniref:Uncharacterized protein n=1 Tax=Symploca sp. SIO1C4 TaxID=2607765 RepID=A0A6B3N803_9CYAN|nr:hypothetical protein [Symploca sp. SIO1C4]